MSLQSIAAKIMFKLPDPILGKIMKFVSPKKDTPNELDPKKYWHLHGNWAPIKEEKSINNLEVIGEIPKELNGQYIRNGMNPRSGYSDHWFFGNGMVHGINIQDGKASYKNRYVKTPYYDDDMDMMSSSFDLKASPANTHVIRHAGKILALEEAHFPWIIDDNLNTIGHHDFNGKLDGPMTAHPRVCPETNELLFFGYRMMGKPYLMYYRVSPEGELVQSEAIDIPRPVMMHDWNITRNFVIFMDLPLVFDMDMAIGGGDPFGFRPECGARLGVMPREGGNKDIKWIDINPCFVFHPMNAYEEDNKIILHVCRQDKAMVGGMDQIYGGDETTGKLWRWTIDLDLQSCKEEQIDDKPCDFARVDDRRTGLKASVGYAMELNNKAETLTFGNNLFKYNLDKGTREDHFLGKHTVGGEPLFAPNPNNNDENNGYIMSLVHDNNKNRSKLLIIDSNDFSNKAVAEVILPQRVPFGAHGSWLEN